MLIWVRKKFKEKLDYDNNNNDELIFSSSSRVFCAFVREVLIRWQMKCMSDKLINIHIQINELE